MSSFPLETPQSFAEPDFLSLDSLVLVLVLVLARRKCPCQIVMPCLRPKKCIFLFFLLIPGQRGLSELKRMICRGTATSRSSLPWLCSSLDQESCAILKRSSDPWCEIAILSQPPLLLFLTDFTLSATFQRIMVVPCLAYLLAKHTTTNVPLEKVTWLSGLVVGRADLTAFEIVGVGVDCRISACHHTFAKARRRQGKIHICTASIHHLFHLPEGNYSPAREIRRKKHTCKVRSQVTGRKRNLGLGIRVPPPTTARD